jgi:hypothetical protein
MYSKSSNIKEGFFLALFNSGVIAGANFLVKDDKNDY